MPTTFDGDNLLIILPTATAEIDVNADLYSEWKDWQLESGPGGASNRKFPQAFSIDGGNPLTPGLTQGSYAFLRNDLGWRIRPAEEDATVNFTGNLIPTDPALPMTVPTVGGFTVIINGLQPITQSVNNLFLAQQDASYRGEIWIDVSGGVPGTTYPIGLPSNAVNNIADAFDIATRIKARKFVLLSSSVALDRAAIDWEYEGKGQSTVDVTGFDAGGSIFFHTEVTGDLATSVGGVRIIDSSVDTLANFLGTMEGCGLGQNISLAAGESEFVRCYSGIIGTGAAIVDCQDLDINVAFRGYKGTLEIENFSLATANASVDSASIHLILGPTVSDGDVVVRGTGELDDNSGLSVNVDTDGFISAATAREDSGIVNELRKLMRNKMITDPVTGMLTVFEDDGITILFQANLFEDASGLQAYRGRGAERREKLDLLGQFSLDFSPEFS
jgi:hypothetical protein